MSLPSGETATDPIRPEELAPFDIQVRNRRSGTAVKARSRTYLLFRFNTVSSLSSCTCGWRAAVAAGYRVGRLRATVRTSPRHQIEGYAEAYNQRRRTKNVLGISD